MENSGERVGADLSARVGRRGDVAVGVEVLGVVVRAGLERGWAPAVGSRDRELAPERVHVLVGVAGQDVGDDVGGLWADDLLAGWRRIRRLDVLARRVLDRQG